MPADHQRAEQAREYDAVEEGGPALVAAETLAADIGLELQEALALPDGEDGVALEDEAHVHHRARVGAGVDAEQLDIGAGAGANL